MSNMKTCDCDRSNYRVLHRNHNHSYFESPKGLEHYSDYSGIICMQCGWHFRSKCKWVRKCPDVSPEELGKMERAEFPVSVNVSGGWVDSYLRL